MGKKKQVKQRSKRRKFLKQVIQNYEDKMDPDHGIEGVPRGELERKKAYYEKQLARL